MAPFKIAGIGELVWDLFPSGKQPGGAPANFAFHLACLGDEGIVVSGVGEDELGEEALEHLSSNGLSTRYVQHPPGRPTGTVQVTVDLDGQPAFDIRENVAWDFLEYSDDLKSLGGQLDAACFGTLAQRSPMSRATTLRLLDDLPVGVLKIFDVNLRQSFYDAETVRESLRRADIVKLNHDELPAVCRMLEIEPQMGIEGSACALLGAASLRLIVVTRGKQGSVLADSSGAIFHHSGYPARVVDTVGAGDAFTAALTHFYLRGGSLEVLSEAGNRLGAWVASQPGATPPGSVKVASDLCRSLGG